MPARVLIIGGYGNFGGFIARRLSREPEMAVIVAGRSAEKARALAADLKTEWATIDIARDLDAGLAGIKPDIVIHTSGPFQGQGYGVAEACVRRACHYIDLADGREFVTGISRLDDAAKAAGVLVVSGASSLPALTSAIIDRYVGEFHELKEVSYGIATAQKTSRGLATTRAVLSYAGKPFTTLIDGRMQEVYGWQGLHWRTFPGLGRRSLGNCDVPDLTLFPRRYPSLTTLRFYAGLELPIVHLSLWAMTWLVRAGLVSSLASAARVLLALARPLDRLGTDRSGLYMELAGIDAAGRRKQLVFDLTARSGDGTHIPCIPAIGMALAIARGDIRARGAAPCVGFLDLDALLDALKPLDIRWHLTA